MRTTYLSTDTDGLVVENQINILQVRRNGEFYIDTDQVVVPTGAVDRRVPHRASWTGMPSKTSCVQCASTWLDDFHLQVGGSKSIKAVVK